MKNIIDHFKDFFKKKKKKLDDDHPFHEEYTKEEPFKE